MATRILARHVSVDAACIPPAALDAARWATLDTVGVVLGATGQVEVIEPLARLVLDAGGRPESTVIGYGTRIPAWEAAFVNGAYAHALDFDDTFEAPVCHPSAPVVLAALALAERTGGVSGADFLAAVAVGQDVFVRLAAALVPSQHGLHTTLTIGGLAAAAAGARLLGLDAGQTVAALTAATCEAGAPRRLVTGQGSDIRSTYVGFAARDGVQAALLGRAGLQGVDDVIEGDAGLVDALFGGRWDRAALLDGLGEHFAGAGTGFKPWPSCRVTHGYIEAVAHLVDTHGLVPDDVAGVTAWLGPFTAGLVGGPRRPPATTADAKLHLPFVLANQIRDGALGIGSFAPPRLGDPSLLALAERVTLVDDPSLEAGPGSSCPARVEIVTTDGRAFRHQIDHAYGHPSNPMSPEAMVAKFVDCSAAARNPLPEAALAALVDGLVSLDEAPDVARTLDPLHLAEDA